MAIIEKVTQDDLILYEILKNPVLCGEFIQNIDKLPHEDSFKFTDYQEDFMCDFGKQVSIACGRAVGKTVSLSNLIIWVLINNLFPKDYIVYTVPNKVHLDPVFTTLTRMFRSNSLLKYYLQPKKGINSSDFTINLLNGATLLCRIAGQSGTGANVIGLHTPFILLDECIVGTQRVMVSGANKRACDIKIGDNILSWNGENIEEDRVVSINKTERNQKVFELAFDNNTKIRVGENHKIFTDSGYIEANKLSIGDFIYYTDPIKNKKYWSSEEKNLVISDIHNGVPIKNVAEKLNRTEQSIFKMLYREDLSVKDIFQNIQLSKEQESIIRGSLLGDGSSCIYTSTATFSTNHSLKQKEYVDWLYEKLSNITRTGPRIYKNGGFGDYNYSFSTLSIKELYDIASVLYINGKKTITRKYLDKLDALSLAVWWMDDGSNSGILSTHSFSKEENEIVIDWIKDKFNISCKLYKDTRKDLYFIGMNAIEKEKLNQLLCDYIPPFMQYKIGNGSYNNEFVEPTINFIGIGENLNSLQKVEITNIREVNTRAKYLYNFEVEKNHNYFVNGVLTKNSGYYPWGTWLELQPTRNTWTPGSRVITSGVPTGLREANVLYYTDMIDDNYSKHRISAYDNPRFTEEDEENAVIQYGGKENEDFIHFILGRHGKPSYAIFDRSLFKIEPYPVYKLKIDGLQLGEEIAAYVSKIRTIPNIEGEGQVAFGIDLGYTEPTAIVILHKTRNGAFKFHARIELKKVQYPVQEILIDILDSKFNPVVIGIDKGSSGISVIQHLLRDLRYTHKKYSNIIVEVDFSSDIVIGVDQDNGEIKSKTKPFSTSVLQDYSNTGRIIYSSTDLELITELERMTYTKTPTGNIVYRTLTQQGGQRGDDHFTAAMLCFSMANYLLTDYINVRGSKKLVSPEWM